MQIDFFTDGISTPGSRFRVEQYREPLAARGYHSTILGSYGKNYSSVAQTRWGNAYRVACRLKRAAVTSFGPLGDVTFLQRSSFLQLALPEIIRARRGVPLVFDFDDAIFLSNDGSNSLLKSRAFDEIVKASSVLIAGNDWLAARANCPEKTMIVPTCLDTSHYIPLPEQERTRRNEQKPFVIGWMGSFSNFPSLRLVVPAVLSFLERTPNAIFRVVSNGRLPELEGRSQVEQLPWSAQAEVELLQSFHVGLMPLARTPIQLGKCAFKIIQYMAVGSPILASRFGANTEVCLDEETGFLYDEIEEFEFRLEQLRNDPELRIRMGNAGRQRAISHYDIEFGASQLIEAIDRAQQSQ